MQQGDQHLLLAVGPLEGVVVAVAVGTVTRPDIGEGMLAVEVLRPGSQVEAVGCTVEPVVGTVADDAWVDDVDPPNGVDQLHERLQIHDRVEMDGDAHEVADFLNEGRVPVIWRDDPFIVNRLRQFVDLARDRICAAEVERIAGGVPWHTHHLDRVALWVEADDHDRVEEALPAAAYAGKQDGHAAARRWRRGNFDRRIRRLSRGQAGRRRGLADQGAVGIEHVVPGVGVDEQVEASSQVADDDHYSQGGEYHPVATEAGVAHLATQEGVGNRREPPGADQDHQGDCDEADVPFGQEPRRQYEGSPAQFIRQEKQNQERGYGKDRRQATLAGVELSKACLLYTSDAADDLLCVDLGGRRIIKK